MTNRERALAVLRYQPYDRLPVVHFGFWRETLQKWASEGHIPAAEAQSWGDGNPTDAVLSAKLGFDFNWYSTFSPNSSLRPGFEHKVIRTLPDGTRHELDGHGVVVVRRPEAGSIPAEIEHTLKDRATWEAHYRHRYQWSPERVLHANVRVNDRMVRFDQGGLEFLKSNRRDYAYGLHCGSLYGNIRNILGVEGSCYLQVDDEPLFDEIIATVGDLCYQTTKFALESGAKFDFGHFWEDICFKNGPLIAPAVFAEKVGPQYRRITKLLAEHGIDIVSLDCDGLIDALIPTWLSNGVNTMFPIEVGTWNASLAPWRHTFGRELRGVGGMNKCVFARDRAAVEAEVARLQALVKLGGFIPCPDHRIAPDAKWELVRYYCELMRGA
jgi:uroporphyrinogen decarboxylase